VAKVYVYLIGFVCSESSAAVAGRQRQKFQPLPYAWRGPIHRDVTKQGPISHVRRYPQLAANEP
jgi:hypothetical protein